MGAMTIKPVERHAARHRRLHRLDVAATGILDAARPVSRTRGDGRGSDFHDPRSLWRSHRRLERRAEDFRHCQRGCARRDTPGSARIKRVGDRQPASAAAPPTASMPIDRKPQSRLPIVAPQPRVPPSARCGGDRRAGAHRRHARRSAVSTVIGSEIGAPAHRRRSRKFPSLIGAVRPRCPNNVASPLDFDRPMAHDGGGGALMMRRVLIIAGSDSRRRHPGRHRGAGGAGRLRHDGDHGADGAEHAGRAGRGRRRARLRRAADGRGAERPWRRCAEDRHARLARHHRHRRREHRAAGARAAAGRRPGDGRQGWPPPAAGGGRAHADRPAPAARHRGDAQRARPRCWRASRSGPRTTCAPPAPPCSPWARARR